MPIGWVLPGPGSLANWVYEPLPSSTFVKMYHLQTIWRSCTNSNQMGRFSEPIPVSQRINVRRKFFFFTKLHGGTRYTVRMLWAAHRFPRPEILCFVDSINTTWKISSWKVSTLRNVHGNFEKSQLVTVSAHDLKNCLDWEAYIPHYLVLSLKKKTAN